VPLTLWKKCTFPFHIIVRTLKTFFAKQFQTVLEEKKAGKTVGPRGKAAERDVSLESSSLTLSDPAVHPHKRLRTPLDGFEFFLQLLLQIPMISDLLRPRIRVRG